MARRSRRLFIEPETPQYEWALDATGEPVHVSQALRGDTYVCPLCGDRMIARLGEIKRHHFAHETLKVCTPQGVARAAAGRWIHNRVRDCLNTRQSVTMTWPCPLCEQTHTSDLLQDITDVRQNYRQDEAQSDIALLDERGTVRSVILLARPSADALAAYARQSVAAIVVDVTRRRGRLEDLAALLKGSPIYGGICDTQKAAAKEGIVTDADALRRLLTGAVSTPPYSIYGPLDNVDNLTHVFLLGQRRLWLPPILWQRAIGGLHHTINPALQIVSQEWPQPDGAVIALYYITAQTTHAIAVRRYPPGQPIYARLDASMFRPDRFTAANIARAFAEQ
jgi:predicted RNA-binding Zn-ribbon protein involved in translation (DUF1610 family)